MIIDRTTLGNVLQVDFTGAPIRNVTFTLNNSGAYDADPDVAQSGVKWQFGRVNDA